MKFDPEIIKETCRQLTAEGHDSPWPCDSDQRVIDAVLDGELEGYFDVIGSRYMSLMRKKLTDEKASDEKWFEYGFGGDSMTALHDWYLAGKLDWMSGVFI